MRRGEEETEEKALIPRGGGEGRRRRDEMRGKGRRFKKRWQGTDERKER